MKTLNLPEKLLLLALDDEKGSVAMAYQAGLPTAVAGALFLEMLHKDLLKNEGKRVFKTEGANVACPMMRIGLDRFHRATKPKTIKNWIQSISGDFRSIEKLVIQNLQKIGALKEVEKTLLWVFTYCRYPTEDARIENQIRRKLHQQVLGEVEIDEEGFLLLSLIGAAKLESEVFSKDVLKTAKRVVKNIMSEEQVGTVVSDIVRETQAAITAAVIASCATTTVVTS
ncbi:MAG: GPP34 family phosphoprotein [Opitutales bacterium]|nr:GPP34 family phosphoprotein [Opitutales bacterium]